MRSSVNQWFVCQCSERDFFCRFFGVVESNDWQNANLIECFFQFSSGAQQKKAFELISNYVGNG